jgi:RHS repeat-associated protein
MRIGGSCTGTPTVDVLYWRNIAGNTIAETDSTGSTINANYHEYIFFAGRRVARSDVSSAQVYYYFVDHLGSTRIMTQANGTVCFDSEYFPYGQELNHTNTCNTANATTTTYRFTGYERDGETGLDYAFARYYNSRLGRFMSGDPLDGDTSDPQSLNRYPYARNNPINLVDPSGLVASGYHPSDPIFSEICPVFFGGSIDNPFDAGFGGFDFGFTGLSHTGGFGCSTELGRDWLDFHSTPLHSDSGGGGQGTTPTPTPPPSPAPAPQPTSWWGTFIKTFTTNLVSSEFWNQEMGPGGCLDVFAQGVDQADVVAPITDSMPNAVEDTAKATAVGFAFKYSARRALTYPLRSSAVRSILGAGEAAGTYFAPVYLDTQLAFGVAKEGLAAYRGTCH